MAYHATGMTLFQSLNIFISPSSTANPTAGDGFALRSSPPQQQPPPPPPPPQLLPQYGEAGGSGAGTAAGSAAGPLVSFL